MPVMVGTFAAMNAMFLSAMVMGTAANAIFLQNTAPFLVYLICVYLLKEPPDRRSFQSILLGMAGVCVIIVGGWEATDSGGINVLLMALGSGITYAMVIIFLRNLKHHSAQWLTTQNQLGSAFTLGLAIMLLWGPTFFLEWVSTPTAKQIAFIGFFGVIQMAMPYWLFTKGLRTVSPQEAGTITLIEPILNPVWSWIVASEVPSDWTLVGGFLILGGLAWRYLPRKRQSNHPPQEA
jgi:drug/metabolite transporter (DMT)-like permease